MRWDAPGSALRVGGHRGASALAPENTMASFRLAEATGADYVELDVQRSRDGQLVVIHDETLDRTTNGRGRVDSADAVVLDGFDAGSWFGRQFAGEHIPRLSGVLAWLATLPATGAMLEAKGAGTAEGIVRMIAGFGDSSRLSVCSFEPAELRAAAVVGPAIARLLIVDRDARAIDLVASARDAAATGVNVPWDWLDAEAVSRLHHAGLMVAGGTIEREALPQCLAIGIDLVDSNDPGAVVGALEEPAT
jgi:glycerophosphoryl diester phosphodiesterase